MKRNALILILVIFGLLGCSNELELYKFGDPTPIVYCLLNSDADVQYVRLSKTFLTKQAIDSVNPDRDSTLWDIPIEIYIEKYGDDGDPEEVIYFESTSLPAKDSGFFPDNNYHLYQANFQPDIGKTYVLYAYFKNPERLVSGKTIIMNPPKVIDPSNVLYRSLTFDSLSSMYIRWQPVDFGGLYQGFFRFHYAEVDGNTRVNMHLDFPTPVYSIMGTDITVEKSLNPQNFFKFLNQNLEVKPDIKRVPSGIEYFFYSTGEDLALWYNTLNDGSSSQTSLFEYSNIEGGKGIFTSWTTQRVPNIPLSLVSIRNLKTNPLTKDLGFSE